MAGAPRDETGRWGADVVREVVAGLATSTLCIGISISFAFLVFTGVFAPFLPRAIGAAVVGAGVVAVILAFRSKTPGVIGAQQDTPAVVLGAAAAQMSPTVDPDAAEATIFVFVAAVSVLVALALLAVGRLRLATAARSVPFPVIAGFLAGTGWILAHAGIEVMAGGDIGWTEARDLLTWSMAQLWMPGFALAALVVGVGNRFGNGLLLPVGLVIVGLGVHGVGRIFLSASELEDRGFLLGPFPDSDAWAPVSPSDVADADWTAIVGQALPVAGVVGVAVLSAVLNVAGIDATLDEELDFDDELGAAGWTSAGAALVAGYPSYHQLSGTAIARTIGSRTPISAVALAVVSLVVMISGTGLIGLIPRAVVGGVLATVGLTMLADWIRQVRSRLRPVDAALSALILAAIIGLGVLVGIGVGLLVAVLGFVYSYARIDPIRRVHRLSSTRSVADRPAAHWDALAARHDAAVAVELVGYLFFGSVRRVGEVIAPLIDSKELRHLVIDFSAVRGIDSSVVQGLAILERRIVTAGVEAHWSGLDEAWGDQLRRGGVPLNTVYPDLDHALEAVEGAVLHDHGIEPEAGEPHALVEALLSFGEIENFEVGHKVIDVDDSSDDLYFVLDGSVTAWGAGETGQPIRFRRVGPGGVVGEVGFVGATPRTATVRADVPVKLLRLTRAEWDRLATDDPDLRRAVERDLFDRIAERLAYTSAAYSRAMRT